MRNFHPHIYVMCSTTAPTLSTKILTLKTRSSCMLYDIKLNKTGSVMIFTWKCILGQMCCFYWDEMPLLDHFMLPLDWRLLWDTAFFGDGRQNYGQKHELKKSNRLNKLKMKWIVPSNCKQVVHWYESNTDGVKSVGFLFYLSNLTTMCSHCKQLLTKIYSTDCHGFSLTETSQFCLRTVT